ncbi:MAG: DUF1501 domain-containing protein [Caldilineaceae bacterium]
MLHTNPFTINRRSFLKGCASFSAFATLRGFGITNMVFEPAHAQATNVNVAQPTADNRDLLVYVFVRGGMDGLNVVTPFNTSKEDTDLYYNQLRRNVNIPAPNSGAARTLVDLDGRFGLHPDAARAPGNAAHPDASDQGGLYQVFTKGDLAIVHATGSPYITGSHFDSELYVDLGRTSGDSGWITRYLQAINAPEQALIVAPQQAVPPSLAGTYGALTVPRADNFGPVWSNTGDPYNNSVIAKQRDLLLATYGHTDDFVSLVGRRAFTAFDALSPVLAQPYTPAGHYLVSDWTPDGGTFGQAMMTIARIAKANLAEPLRVACVDVGGGYDTHDNEGTVDWDGNPRFPQLVMNLANNLKAFYDDMNADATWRGRFTVVVLSEFGRVLYENNSGGCDHGYGNIMFVMGSGGNINGGHVYGNWPGLRNFGFNDGLQITTDYRLVLTDILLGRLGVSAAQLSTVFPGFTPGALLGIAKPAVQAAASAPLSEQIFLPTIRR